MVVVGTSTISSPNPFLDELLFGLQSPFALCFCVLNAKGFIKCVFRFHPVCSFNFFHQIPLIRPSSLEFTSSFQFRSSDHHVKWVLQMCQKMVLDHVLWSKSLLPNWNMNCEFMCKNMIFPFMDMPFFAHAPPFQLYLIEPWNFLFEFNFKSIFIGCHSLAYPNH